MEIKIDNNEINYALAVKLNMLKREGLPLLNLEDFTYVVYHGKWKDQIPTHSSSAIDDILGFTAEDVVVTLTRLALTEHATSSIDEYRDLLGGNLHENK